MRTKRVKLLILAGVLLAGMVQAQDAMVILEKVDRNMSSDNRVMESSMTVHGKRSSRTITSRSWGEGTKKAFTEYLSPASEKGTKMLKLEGQLWIYSPSTDRVIQISGHMLRQPVMGSDLSYEDMMDDRKLSDVYTAKVSGEENVGDRRAWVMELTAKVTDIAYYRQKLWVDQERFIPLKQDLFARGGQLLKRTEMSDVRQVQGRWFPFTVLYKDMLKQGGGTEFKVTTIRFNDKIPDYIFTKAALKQ
ncbi:MAG TPA: outer membrane lipoprotein-sorting protein [Prolixibacteraceae bacterium]|jgi:outer membrane lipoprotein-sorting protein|nr:outer membrane lipoprotein-sorting protein [Prolixibacteraceae bacterium]HPJ77464.1 outer membrane lipoprotein-sorting protein [Prolixibacteraceae bacterium]HRV88030.1 outer membrane lipoprotein-sorting protein [Prolixibacteraceae bacterium]